MYVCMYVCVFFNFFVLSVIVVVDVVVVVVVDVGFTCWRLAFLKISSVTDMRLSNFAKELWLA